MLKLDGCGKEKVAGRRAQDGRLGFGNVSSNQPRAVPFKDQSWFLALGSPVVRVIGFVQPVVEGRGGELQFPARNVEPSVVAFLIRRGLPVKSPRFRGQGCNFWEGLLFLTEESLS